MKELTTVGHTATIDLIDFGISDIVSKVDTGADSSSIWVSQVSEQPEGLCCVFFGPGSPYYTGEIICIAKNYSVTRIANSFGHKEVRYKVRLKIRLQGRVIRATFTLADRSLMTYPVLLGRRLLHGKFLVDVSKGEPLLPAALPVETDADLQTLREDQS